MSASQPSKSVIFVSHAWINGSTHLPCFLDKLEFYLQAKGAKIATFVDNCADQNGDYPLPKISEGLSQAVLLLEAGGGVYEQRAWGPSERAAFMKMWPNDHADRILRVAWNSGAKDLPRGGPSFLLNLAEDATAAAAKKLYWEIGLLAMIRSGETAAVERLARCLADTVASKLPTAIGTPQALDEVSVRRLVEHELRDRGVSTERLSVSASLRESPSPLTAFSVVAAAEDSFGWGACRAAFATSASLIDAGTPKAVASHYRKLSAWYYRRCGNAHSVMKATPVAACLVLGAWGTNAYLADDTRLEFIEVALGPLLLVIAAFAGVWVIADRRHKQVLPLKAALEVSAERVTAGLIEAAEELKALHGGWW